MHWDAAVSHSPLCNAKRSLPMAPAMFPDGSHGAVVAPCSSTTEAILWGSEAMTSPRGSTHQFHLRLHIGMAMEPGTGCSKLNHQKHEH
jgi:hypothetical protein